MNKNSNFPEHKLINLFGLSDEIEAILWNIEETVKKIVVDLNKDRIEGKLETISLELAPLRDLITDIFEVRKSLTWNIRSFTKDELLTTDVLLEKLIKQLNHLLGIAHPNELLQKNTQSKKDNLESQIQASLCYT